MILKFADGKIIPAINPMDPAGGGVSIGHVMRLKMETREFTEDGKGIGTTQLTAMMREARVYEMARRRAAKEGTEPPDPPDCMDMWLAVVVYLSRRQSGERISFWDSIEYPVAFIPEPGDVKDEEDETNPPEPTPDGKETPDKEAATSREYPASPSTT